MFLLTSLFWCKCRSFLHYFKVSTELPKYYTRLQTPVAQGLGWPAGRKAVPHIDAASTVISVQFLSAISSNVSSVRTWRRRLTFLFFTEPVSLNLLTCFLIVTGIRHRSSWKLYSKFASCFRTRLSAFHIHRIVNIQTFPQWEFLSRHVTDRNNHNHYAYSTNV